MALIVLGLAILGPAAGGQATADDGQVVSEAPFDFTEICYKITWPPGTECYQDFAPASSGVISVGGVRVIAAADLDPVMPPHVSKMGVGTRFRPQSAGQLSVVADLVGYQVINAVGDETLACIAVGDETSCSNQPQLSRLEISSRLTHVRDHVVQVFLEKPYSGVSFLKLRRLTLSFVPDEVSEVP